MPQGKLLSRTWILLLTGVVVIRLTILRADWVERYYASFIYPKISFLQRSLTGHVPFSLGDLLYIGAGIWVLIKLVSTFRSLGKTGVNWMQLLVKTSSLIKIFLWIYIIFNVLWGLNYNRPILMKAFGLEPVTNQAGTDLPVVTGILLDKTNRYRSKGMVPDHRTSAAMARRAYARAREKYPTLDVRPYAIKPSIFGALGSYMGYSGYYNPFTGEAQVNTAVPGFLIPFVTCHEMAHQAGYAKENEANLCGFLAARESRDSAMLYSAYLSMFLYANRQLAQDDSSRASVNLKMLNPAVRRDLELYRKYLAAHQSVLGDAVDMFYNQYLKLNEQPAGSRTYGLVVEGLIAYYRKFGDL